MDRERASGARSQRQSAWRRIPIQEWCERIFRRNEGIKLAGGRAARELAPDARSSLRLTPMSNHGGTREGAGRPAGSSGRTVESRSVSMRFSDWEKISLLYLRPIRPLVQLALSIPILESDRCLGLGTHRQSGTQTGRKAGSCESGGTDNAWRRPWKSLHGWQHSP